MRPLGLALAALCVAPFAIGGRGTTSPDWKPLFPKAEGPLWISGRDRPMHMIEVVEAYAKWIEAIILRGVGVAAANTEEAVADAEADDEVVLALLLPEQFEAERVAVEVLRPFNVGHAGREVLQAV